MHLCPTWLISDALVLLHSRNIVITSVFPL